MIVLGLLQLFLIVAITLYEYKNKSSIVFLWAVLLVMFGIMHTVSYCLPDYAYEVEVLDEASYFVIVFCIIYFITRSILRKLYKAKQETKPSPTGAYENKVLLWSKATLLLSVLIHAFFIIRASGSLLEVSNDSVYRTMAKGNIVYLLCVYLYYASVPVFVYCLKKKRNKDVLFVAVLVVIRTIMSSSRMDMIILFVGIISCIVLNAKTKSIKKVIVLGVIGVIGLVTIYALRTFRYYYGLSNLESIELSVFVNQMADFVKNDSGELGLRQVFYYFIQHNNNFAGFGTGNGYKRVLLFMIPGRFTFGLKPEDMCVVMGRAWLPDFKGIIQYTVTPTLFGDCYANFGFTGCLMGAFWALVGTVTDYLVNRKTEINRLILFGLMGIEYIVIGRGSVYNPICHMWYCGILVALINLLSKMKIGRRYKFYLIQRGPISHFEK